uniref:PIN_6 domain-containing protein n=1 Tax=Caenorhabditis japonica TaxID=281687 RepID=A0A8R1IK04_CAEJA
MAATKDKPIKHLVLDTCVIINNPSLHTLAEHYYAPPQILDELRSVKARKAWDLLPFEVELREPSNNAVRAVIDASKVTGDFQSLSMVDIKMIALTFDLHAQYVDEKTAAVESSEEDQKRIIEELSGKIEKVEVKDENEDSAVVEDEEEEEER